MATTLKMSISPYSPQCEEQCVTYKISILQNFQKIYSIYNIVLQTIVWAAPHFLTLDVTVPNTIYTHEFCPSIISGSKFKIPSQYFVVNFGSTKDLVNFSLFYPLLCSHSSTNCKFLKTHQLIIVALAQAP